MRARESNCVRSYKRLEPFAKLATSYVIDLNLGPQWECNFGVGFGLTPATDRLLVKLIVGYRFGLGSGGHKGY